MPDPRLLITIRSEGAIKRPKETIKNSIQQTDRFYEDITITFT